MEEGDIAKNQGTKTIGNEETSSKKPRDKSKKENKKTDKDAKADIVKSKKSKKDKKPVKRRGRIKKEWFEVVSRKEWNAEESRKVKKLTLPVKHVFVTTTRTDPCGTMEECKARVRDLQKLFMEENGLIDIPYNFLVGGNDFEMVFEGRGWTKHPIQLEVMDHDVEVVKKPFLSFAFISNSFMNVNQPVPAKMQTSLHRLIDFGVKEGLLEGAHWVDVCTLHHPDDTYAHFSPAFHRLPVGRFKPPSNKVKLPKDKDKPRRHWFENMSVGTPGRLIPYGVRF